MNNYTDDIGKAYCGCAHEVDTTPAKQEKWHKQRDKRGFDDTELWSLDLTIIKFILPRLEEFKKKVQGHPTDMSFKEWKGILNKIIKGLKLRLEDTNTVDTDETYVEAKHLLFKWFDHLWN